jgi:hypothetical protein
MCQPFYIWAKILPTKWVSIFCFTPGFLYIVFSVLCYWLFESKAHMYTTKYITHGSGREMMISLPSAFGRVCVLFTYKFTKTKEKSKKVLMRIDRWLLLIPHYLSSNANKLLTILLHCNRVAPRQETWKRVKYYLTRTFDNGSNCYCTLLKPIELNCNVIVHFIRSGPPKPGETECMLRVR